MNSKKKNIIFSVITLFIGLFLSLLVVEFMIRCLAAQDLSGTWFVYGKSGILLNKAEGQARHQQGNRIAIYHFNKYHLRGGSINRDGQKVLVLGDSFTFGWLLDEKYTYVHLLQSYADNEIGKNIFYFLNGGTGGWGTADYLSYLEDYGEAISPNIVLVFLNTDDIGRAIKRGIYRLKDTSTTELERIKLSPRRLDIFLKNINKSLFFYQWLLEHSHLVQLLRKSYFLFRDLKIRFQDESAMVPTSQDIHVSSAFSKLFGQALFHRLKKWCDTHNARLFVLTTGYFGFSKKDSSEPTMDFMAKAKDIFVKQSIPFHDISAEVTLAEGDNANDYFISPTDPHPNEAGSELIAIQSWKWLKPKFQEIVRK